MRRPTLEEVYLALTEEAAEVEAAPRPRWPHERRGGHRGRARGVAAGRLFVHQLRSEQLVFWRSREAAFFIFLFPLLLFLLLGSVYSGTIYGVPAAQALLAGLIGYGCANTAFAGLAIQLVLRRENGILKRLRSTPLPRGDVRRRAARLDAARLRPPDDRALRRRGARSTGRRFPRASARSSSTVVLGAAAFAALGTALASVIRSGEGSSAVVNFILLPMAFLTGSFGPTRHFPRFLRAVGDVLPLKYFIDLVDAMLPACARASGRSRRRSPCSAPGAQAGSSFAALRFRWEPRSAS